MPAAVLSDRQTQILGVLRLAIEVNGYPPSIREVADHVGLAVSSVQRQLIELESKGFIQRDPNRPRTLTILGDDPLRAARSEGWVVGHVRCICRERPRGEMPECRNPYEED